MSAGSARSPWVGTALGYGVPALLVAVLIGALISVQANAEAAVSDFAGALPIGFGRRRRRSQRQSLRLLHVARLRAYQLGTQEAGYDQLSASRRVARALGVGLMATLGFVLIFAAVGAVIAAGGTFLSRVFPFLGLSVGVLMVIFGAYLLITHRYIGVLAAAASRSRRGATLGNASSLDSGTRSGRSVARCRSFWSSLAARLALPLPGLLQPVPGLCAGMGVVVIAVTIGAAIFGMPWPVLAQRATPRPPCQFALSGWRRRLPHYYWVFFAGLNL